MADENPQNRDEGKCPQNGVKWKDLMSTLILDRLEASFGNCRDDELPQTMAQTIQNMTNNRDGCQQCNTSGGESSSTKYFDSAWNDDTCHQHSTTDHNSACTSLLNGCSTDGFLNGNNSCCRCNMKPQLYSVTNHLNSKQSISEKIKKNETANIQQQVEIFRKRVECMLKMNCQLQSELKKTIKTNLLMEQYISWPYAVNNGKVEFPGRNDLTWQDLKADAKKKQAQINKNVKGTAGGPSTTGSLDSLSEMLVGMIGVVPISGDPLIRDYPVCFDFDSPNRQQNQPLVINVPNTEKLDELDSINM